MAKFSLPANSKVQRGRIYPATEGAKNSREFWSIGTILRPVRTRSWILIKWIWITAVLWSWMR